MRQLPFSWTCPFCSHAATISDLDYTSKHLTLRLENVFGPFHAVTEFIVCPNPECKKFTLEVQLHEAKLTHGGFAVGDVVGTWRLVPPSDAKVFPDYVPEPIREDYTEACLIRDLSPKASATLSRRCLQGMIRDFWGIRKGTLYDEIEELQSKVNRATWDAIDATRSVGNIRAHMEKDINVIIEVEPEEADQLIWLIEFLIEEWYVNDHDRQERLKAVVAVAEAKKQAKKNPSANSQT